MLVNTNDDKNHKSYVKVVRIYSAITNHMRDKDIEHLLQTEGDINYRTPEGVPNLLHAASNRLRHTNLLNLLLDHGADYTLKDEQGRTFVHKIIQEQTSVWFNLPLQRTFKDERVDSILAAHVKFNNPANPRDKNGISHFHAACMTNNAESVTFFMNRGVNANEAVNSDSSIFPSYTALELAVKYTSPDVVEILLKHGANVHTKNTDGLSPLHSVIERKISKSELADVPRLVRTLNILIEFAIDNDMENDCLGFSKLHVACLLEDEILVENILNKVTNVDRRVNSDSPVCPGYTALHFAAHSNVQIFKLLLKYGANIEAQNAKGQTPLDLCLQNYNIKDIHSIISSKKEWENITLSDNKTKLSSVVLLMGDFSEFVSFLDLPRHFKFSNRYIPFESPLWPGYTLLHLAVILSRKFPDPNVTVFGRMDDVDFVKELLKRERDTSVTNANSLTPLHLAFYMQKRDVVRCLLGYNHINLNPADENNLSHFHIACASGDEQSVRFFLSIPVNVNDPVNSKFDWYTSLEHSSAKRGTRHFSICPGSTVLHIAVVCGNYIITDKLIKHGADVNARDANGFTPVHRLLSCGDEKAREHVKQSLLKAGNLRNITTDCGLGHLHVACYFGHLEAVEKLLKAGADVRIPVVDTLDSRVKDYDEFFCDSGGNYRESWPFLADFSNYTPLEFLWHSHQKSDECDIKIFWKISFILIKRDADVFAKTDKGISVLRNFLKKINSHGDNYFYAMISENIPTLVRLEEEFGVTKLHLACCFGDVKAVEKLLKNGANVNAKVYSNWPIWQGSTPLHFVLKRAVINENWDAGMIIIRLLMKHGADPLLVNCNNEAPFHVIKCCQNRGFDESIRLWEFITCMFEYVDNYNVNPTDNQGLSIFHIACATQNKFAVEQFLKSGVDVNRALRDFSCFSPGSTALHLLMKYYHELSYSSSMDVSNDETFLQILIALLEKGADVNATDAFGKSPLYKAVTLTRSRRNSIEILISNGADVHATLMPNYNTPFELLIMQRDATLEEIELFLKAGCQLNAYNVTSHEGFMAKIFRYQHRITYAVDDMMDNPVFIGILNDPKIAEIDDAGRTAIHNVVSIDYVENGYIDHRIHKYESPKYRFWLTSKEKAKRRRPIFKPTRTYTVIYPGLIEQLCIRGCDIDHEDNEGKTALHLAVAFNNGRAIVPLLTMGADINIVDKNGKTAFAYCCEISLADQDLWNDELRSPYSYDAQNYTNKVLAVHVYKLKFCGQRVDEQNRRLQGKTLNILGRIPEKVLNGFHEEMEATKNINVGDTPFSLYDFLTNTDTDSVYMNMTSEERLEIDRFFQNVRTKHNFVEIDCLLRLKYRQSIERKKLIEPALESLNSLSRFELPDLCGRYILKFLKNEDLKRLITSVTSGTTKL